MLLLHMIVLLVFTGFTACKKDDDKKEGGTGGGNSNAQYVLVIENGAQTIESGKSIQYSAMLVDVNGDVKTANGVSWSTSNQDVATISSAGAITTVGPGSVVITASVTLNGVNYTTSVPLGISLPSVFAVAPSAIIWSTDAGTIDLHPIYFGTGNPTYTFASSDENIAKVSSSGVVSFMNTGSCEITVTANGLEGNPSVKVPVMVVGEPSLPLPIVRIAVTPETRDMFRNENQAFSAKAYNDDKAEVATTFTWKVTDEAIGTISNSGVFTAKSIGKTTIQATAEGIIGQAEVIVNPDTIIIIEPFMVTVAKGASHNLVAKTYKINRSTREVNLISNPAGITWEVASMGLPMFDVASVDASGKVTVKQDAMEGVMAFVMASLPNTTVDPGVCTVMVGEEASSCNCGPDDSRVSSITTSQHSFDLNITGTSEAQIGAKALDADETEIGDAAIVYCSQLEAVATVDSDGTIHAMSPGNTAITVCVGAVKTTVNVSVSF